ncbi:LacI family DNA-binding transcriptional regulator [Streptomyces antimycoticus]|uniref:LacI family transcriptional regulator n=1 Tax=Streptomyces antimycoticus TaxID=68175 RepID=A0A4D4JTI9_9ACTN|nr:LacI family DNA-binding transcriptional regulator [Streptomyces antimycoticus]GDY40025.1 LacI family transcriptional regulator [Streptomyces antimycoticus]
MTNEPNVGTEARRPRQDRGTASPSDSSAPTLRDVGARAGVSTMTASRALRGDASVAPDTRQRVLAAASDLKYRRNELARNLRTGGASGMVGLVVPNLANPFYSELALGVETALAQRGTKVVLSNTGGDARREREVVEDLVARRMDGIIVVPTGGDQSHLDPARLQDTPVVLAALPAHEIAVDCVLLDDFGGASEATASLIADGHRRIAFLGPPAVWTISERLRGFRSALNKAGIQPDERLIRWQQRDVASAARVAEQVLTLPDPPTAFFCANSRNTLGVCRAVQRLGSDAIVCGFDDFELADMLGISLRLVTYRTEVMGERAASLLMDRVDEVRAGAGERKPLRQSTIPTALTRYTPLARRAT